jgi:hypothetical protein
MEIEEIRHAPWTCRWGRFGGKIEDSPTAGSDDLVWNCCHPELCPVLRMVLADECERCSYWEASVVPPCAAMGWSEG